MLFFPSHDIALAHGVKHFNPPLAALRLQEDLASLSDVWNGPFLRGEVAFPQPWGWDWDTRKYIHEKYKVKNTQLPTDEELERLRILSSRQTTIALVEQLKKRLQNSTFPTPSYLSSMEEVEAFMASHKDYVLKTPWSSSGRGLMRSTVPAETLRKHAIATLQKMGGIMGEPWIEDKVQDFAMLFFVGKCDHRDHRDGRYQKVPEKQAADSVMACSGACHRKRGADALLRTLRGICLYRMLYPLRDCGDYLTPVRSRNPPETV